MEDLSSLVPRTVRVPELDVLMRKIRVNYEPKAVILYGSRARGTAKPDSDWDVLVIVPDIADESCLDPMLGWTTQVGTGVHADVSCAYESEFVGDATVVNSRTACIIDDAVRIDAF